MTQNRKYFGMTTQQAGILVGLVVVACLLFGATGVLALRGGLSGLLARPPERTSTVQPSSTAVFTPTVVMTETPTPIPYEQLIPPNWKQFKNELVEIWLPAQFELADIEKLKAQAKKHYQETGFQEFADLDENHLTFYALVAADDSSGSSLYRTIATVAYEPLAHESLDASIDAHNAGLPAAIRLVERRKLQLGTVEAVRLVYETHQGTLHANELLYVFLDGSTIWSVGYNAEINEFYQQLPLFEDSVKTFRFVR